MNAKGVESVDKHMQAPFAPGFRLGIEAERPKMCMVKVA
jgi:hypothetical protein